MRPIERGPWPTDKAGKPKVFSSYQQARGDLIARVGQYCSYCDQRLPASLAVEHILPKVLVPELEKSWENFLLGCTNCNSTKGDKPVAIDDFLWPHLHNTHLAFFYSADGRVHVHPDLDAEQKLKAQSLLRLVGLQNYPEDPTVSDRRWTNRRDAFVHAHTIRLLYQKAIENASATEFTSLLGITASLSGFFSVWMQVFEDYPDAKRAIISAFPGTAACFDNNGNAEKRTEVL
jgi:uncharacterized protein (TIGR02646 family)